MVERRTHNPQVGGSSPSSATKWESSEPSVDAWRSLPVPIKDRRATPSLSEGCNAGGTYYLFHMITVEELQRFLGQSSALAGIQVEYENDLKKALAPQVVLLTGMVNIDGDPHLFEAEINLMEFNSREDLLLLGSSILKAFDRAGVQTLG